MVNVFLQLDEQVHKEAKSKAALKGLKLYEYVSQAVVEKNKEV